MPVDTIFLDTTYGKEKYKFMKQQQAIQFAVDSIRNSSIRNHVILKRCCS
jgi:hypothetical protein